MSTGGFTEEPYLDDSGRIVVPDPYVSQFGTEKPGGYDGDPVPPPDHDAVIRAALRDAAANAHPDNVARRYDETLAALAEREIAVVPVEALRALLDGQNISIDQWRVLFEAVKETP